MRADEPQIANHPADCKPAIEYVAVHVLWYPDKMMGVVLHRGSQEDCAKVIDATPGIIASGKVRHARGMVIPSEEWERITA